MRTLVLCVVAVLCVLPHGGSAQGDCGSFTNCPDCVAQPLCGWCSVPVIFPGNVTGPQCAGFGKNAEPFVCPAVYSTETCQSGYECDTSGTCQVSPPGTGFPESMCEAMCHPTQMIWACNRSDFTCYQVPPGTPGGSSQLVCNETCNNNPTPSPGPTAPPAAVYSCNVANWTCVVVPPGTGTSLLVCEQTCQANLTLYSCNINNGTCYQVPPPNGVPLSTCQEACTFTPSPTQPPNPGPPPEYIGIWRGVEIQNGYVIGEWDFSINITEVIIQQLTTTGVTQWIGTPYHIPNSPQLEFWIMITSGPNTGSYWRSVGDTSGARGPQTEFGTIAFSTPGLPAPASIAAAMSGSNATVFAIEKCIIGNPYCTFTMAEQQIRYKNHKQIRDKSHTSRKAKKPTVEVDAVANVGSSVDQCSQWGTACSVCISHANCGWCSVDVVYSNGVKGTQCAGFEGNSSQFVCDGTYSTDSCELGYICSSETWQCIATQPGDGMPLAVCEATCKLTPPPPPAVTQYVCNLTSKTCSLCEQAHCPGSMPQAQCEADCLHPYPGPTPDIIGIWRGLYIENRYVTGEVTFVFNTTGVAVYRNNVFYFYATVISLGADVMLLTIVSGVNAGNTFDALYQLADQDFGMYQQMTFAEGVLGGSFPTGYNTPMYTLGEHELVLAKCLEAPCVFVNP